MLSKQQQAVKPSGMRHKGRWAPIIQEQAKQGLATRQVIAQKEKEFREEHFEWEKETSERDYKLALKRFEWEKKQAKKSNTMGWINTGINLVGAFTPLAI